MNIEVTKYELINKLVSTTDERILKQLVAIFNKSGKKSENITIAEYNKELDAAEERIKSGRFTTQEDIERESEEW